MQEGTGSAGPQEILGKLSVSLGKMCEAFEQEEDGF